MSIFQRWVTCSFFHELYSHIDKNSGGKFEDMLLVKIASKTWFSYSCNGGKDRCKHVSDSAPSSFDARQHFDYNAANLTGIVINCSVSSSCNDRSNH